MTDFNKFFKPESIVLLGASSDPRKWGWQILSNILHGGFKGRVYPINPVRDEILGYKVYKSVADVPEVPDLAIIVVPTTSIVTAVRDCAARGIKAAVVITAGFAEIGGKGVVLQKEMVRVAREGGLRLIGPNCFGIVSPASRLYAQMPPIYPPLGSIAVVSQSGNVGSTIGRRAMAINFGLSRLISTGNEADLHVEDFLEDLGRDRQTKVVLSYIEGFKGGRAFFRAAKEVSWHKPIVMIKVGETEAGASAARYHTASLSGSPRVFDGICRQAGVIRAGNIRELMNIGYGFLTYPLPRGKRVGIVTLGGGWGVLAADACARLGLEVVRLSDEVIRELDKLLPGWWSKSNPVDMVGGSIISDNILRVVEVLAKYDQIDSVISLGMPLPDLSNLPRLVTGEDKENGRKQILDHYRKVFGRVGELKVKYGKPIVVAADIFMPRNFVEELDIMCAVTDVGQVFYNQPHEAATVVSALAAYAEYRRRR